MSAAPQGHRSIEDDRRDGRAAQQINVTQVGVTVSADDIARARAIVKELACPTRALPAHETGALSPY
jgi:hypothetical protein